MGLITDLIKMRVGYMRQQEGQRQAAAKAAAAEKKRLEEQSRRDREEALGEFLKTDFFPQRRK